ncbi:phospholipase D [Capronia epimyces CBS 606.96]|uniref:phospholipase D n=1 Tax=Capronia epimyces CBS 606.96 TaxID=1182542 RepID=W9XXA6_9EURO|nr:phospholipase D [Capronia epimyces CBS 606.96]EXJ84838.1 phospholipase D [Capronia epimyces CBS 606.96]
MSYQPPYQQPSDDDALAYGDDYSSSRGSGGLQGTEKSILGDTFRKFKSEYDKYKTPSSQNYGYTSSGTSQQYYGQQSSSGTSQQYYGQQSSSTGYPQPGQSGQSAYPGGPPPQQPQGKPDLGTKLLGTLHGTIHSIGSDLVNLLGPEGKPTPYSNQPVGQQPQGQSAPPGYSNLSASPSLPQGQNRFDSFASEKPGNDVKWYVDGCGYFWAVSQALESARQSIWILDWWLTPEVYLRRPPSQNEQWRLDRTLQRAAQRGVKVNIIVYKEVTQALTLSSAHTKHELEKLSPNISVFRHPDHLPDAQTAHSSLLSSFQNLKLDAAGVSKLGTDALKGIYGLDDDVILYWAHHEKLCLVDGTIAFMGGLDLCFGRWDTNQHAIADAHPLNVNDIVFPGQDYNNARVMDFSDVANPFQNKLDRTKSSRMGWSDVALSLQGPCVQDLRHHFIDRWNFIFEEKYNVRKDARYSRIVDEYPHPPAGPGQRPQSRPQSQGHLQPPAPSGAFPPPPGSQPYAPPAWHSTSRPHTPTGDLYQNQASTVPGTQLGIPGAPPSPSPQSTYSQPSNPQTSYAQPSAATSAYLPVSSPTQLGTFSQPAVVGDHLPNPYLQQNFPPPPPGPPPQLSPSPSPSPGPGHVYTGYQPPTNPLPTYAPYSQPAAELSTQHTPSQPYQPQPYQQQTSPPPYSQPYQPQTYQQPGTEQNRGIDDYATGENRGFDDYGYGDEGARGVGGERGLRSRVDQYRTEGKLIGQELSSISNLVSTGVEGRLHHIQGKYLGATDSYGRPYNQRRGVMTCQLLRSCTKWSNGTPLEHSIQNAYIDVIRNSQHFVYIENQFFITATGDKQKPVQNLVGQAIVERVLRAAKNGEKYKVIVVIPAVPAFAGDLRDDGSLGTRAIMEFQYFSINRGGHSIMEKIAQAGYNPMDYIRFYNLRNYDRINCGDSMKQAQQQSGVRYEDARREHDDVVGAGYGASGERTGATQMGQASHYQQYQSAAHNMSAPLGGRWDSVSECYMLGGQDIRTVPWDGPPEAELDAFVSEELYVHSKCLIADDRVVICGSANLNDRSLLGSHDSEIALLIDDPTPVQTYIGGQPYQASRFAASLRRSLMRKHLGLVRPQDVRRPDANYEPVGVPNVYDWGSPEDNVVSDPLSDTFQSLWNSRARTNTDAFRKAFRAVPDDYVTTWAEYKEFYEYFYHSDPKAVGKEGVKIPPRVEYGHVVREDFPGGVRELKELLSQVKGTLVEMPLCFLQNEDIAKEGLTLNALTEEIYT